MDPAQFEAVAREAVDALPPHLRSALSDVLITVLERPEDHPTASGRSLLGLYEGVPLTAWGRDFSGKLPDRITLFREPIERQAASPEDIPRVIRETVWHEMAHAFGFDHDVIRHMERRWRKKHAQQQTGQP